MSSLDRRAFLRRLGFGTVAAAAAATSVLDVERLLWVPGERTIVIPPLARPTFAKGDLITIDGLWLRDPVTHRPFEVLETLVITEDAGRYDATISVSPTFDGRTVINRDQHCVRALFRDGHFSRTFATSREWLLIT